MAIQVEWCSCVSDGYDMEIPGSLGERSLLASPGLRGSVVDHIGWDCTEFITRVRIGCQEIRVRVSDHGSLPRW